MRFRLTILLGLLAAIGLSGASGVDSAGKPKVKKITIKAVEGLRYEPVRLSAKPGEILELKIENHDPNDQPHNFVLIQPGTLPEIQTASMLIGPDSVANGFIPKSDAILLHSGLLNPEAKETITFEVPKTKGVYPYVCTFPGHALIMYGALYVDTKITDGLAYDPNVPELVRSAELDKLKAILEVERPSFQRIFMPNAGPAAIAVALPEDLNFCWDAGNCRLRYAWSGSFIDATRVWGGNGNAQAKLLGPEFWQSRAGEKVFGVQIGDEPAQRVEFSGYALIDGIPEFEYRVDGTTVHELVRPGKNGLDWRFKIDSPAGDARILAPDSDGAAVSSSIGKREGDFWVVPQKDAAEFTLNLIRK